MATRWEPGPAAPPPPSPELHVWRVELDRGEWPDPALLPVDEQARAARLRRAVDQRRWTAARWALRTVLARYAGGDPAALALGTGPTGKPELADSGAALRFNLSHSHELALIAVSSSTEVGVDVEWVDPRRDVVEIAPHALGPEQVRELLTAPAGERPALFHAAWTRREAAVKCTGVGLAGAPLDDPPGGDDPVAAANLDCGEEYSAAVAVAARRLPPVIAWELANARNVPSKEP
jgi:4'-phosphopantetheinyl transferase